jgi:tRNA threonylcarbamoyladenosine biosynthesis protein TsaE
MPSTLAWTSRAVKQTIKAGEILGKLAPPGAFFALKGPLASGKTHFVKGLARGLEVPDWDLLSSPTFTLVATYEGRLKLHHVDAYRLDTADQIEDLGFEEWVAEEGVTALEWAGKAGPYLPADRLEVAFSHETENERALLFDPKGPSSGDLMENAAALLRSLA